MTSPRIGRPPVLDNERRVRVDIRLPAWLLDHYRASGPGWQTRLADVLEAIERARLGSTQRKEKA